jgi:DNA polymerase III subunit delta
MVAVKNHEAERFLARPPAHIFLYLVFGTDAGLVSERTRDIIQRSIEDPKDPFQFVQITGDELAADPMRLADEANTIPLFGGKRAIVIEAQGKVFLGAIEFVLATPPRDCTIVIEAGALKKDAALRTLCERGKNAAAIQCYPDSGRDIEQLIDAEIRESNLAIAPAAKAFLASLLGQNRLSTRSELEKLVLYAHGKGEINLGDVEAVVSDASSLLVEEAVNDAFGGNFTALDASLRRIFGGAGDHYALLGAALRHALRLHRTSFGGDTRSTGPDAFDPPSSAAWTKARLGRVIETIAEAIARTRREPKLAPALTVRALWTIALSARKTASR